MLHCTMYNTDVCNIQGTENIATRTWSPISLGFFWGGGFVLFKTTVGRSVNRGLLTGCKEAATIRFEVTNRCFAEESKEGHQNRQLVRFQAEM